MPINEFSFRTIEVNSDVGFDFGLDFTIGEGLAVVVG